MAGKLTDKNKVEIVEKYETGNYNCAQLAREYNVTGCAITSMLKRRGIKINQNPDSRKRKYTINEGYFDIIDTEKKAYFLGLMYADGYNDEKRKRICLALQERDIEILEKFNIELGSNRPLRKYIKKKVGHQDVIFLDVYSKRLSVKLAELGCFQKKSLTLKFPTEEQVPTHLLRHFIRGYFDGDGCVGIYKIKNKKDSIHVSVAFCGTLDFVTKLKDFIKIEINKNFCLGKKSLKTDVRMLSIGGVQQTYLFLTWLYNNSCIYLQRKYIKTKEIEKAIIERKLIQKALINPSELE